MTLIFGIVLYFSDKYEITKKLRQILITNVAIIGVFQILSLVPGVSRSGITISLARILKFSRFESAKDFILAFYTNLRSNFNLWIKKYYNSREFRFFVPNFFINYLSFIFSYITIKFFF